MNGEIDKRRKRVLESIWELSHLLTKYHFVSFLSIGNNLSSGKKRDRKHVRTAVESMNGGKKFTDDPVIFSELQVSDVGTIREDMKLRENSPFEISALGTITG